LRHNKQGVAAILAQSKGNARAKPKFLWHFGRNNVLLRGGGTCRGNAERRMRVRTLIRTLIHTLGFVIFLSAVVAPAGVTPACAQLGFDRPGGDYASAPVPSGDPAVCATRCEHDKSCRSWSFSYPSSSGEEAMCWLKREVVPRAKASCCVSGVHGAGVIEPALGEIEFSIDRVGGDYRSFDTAADPRGKACAAACKADTRCRAWTYLRPGYGTDTAQCYLKDRIKPPRRSPCCVSGVVR
jgi:PAN domain